MRTLLFILFQLIGLHLLFSQTSKQAEQIANETNAIVDDKDFVIKKNNYIKYSDEYLKAVSLEALQPDPDSFFIGSCYIKAGNLLLNGKELKKAVSFYKKSIHYYPKYSKNYSIAAYNITLAYKQAYYRGEFIAPVPEEKKTNANCYFTISDVLSEEGNKLEVKIIGGKMNGLIENSSFTMFSSFSNDEREGNVYFGTGRITEVDTFYAKGILNLEVATNNMKPVEGDYICVSAKIKKDNGYDKLYKSALFDIWLVDNDLGLLFFPWQALQNDDPELSEIITNAIVYNVRELTSSYDENDTSIYRSGIFAGVNKYMATTYTEQSDIDEYLNYMSNFPARYLGIRWYASKIYVNWLSYSYYKAAEYPEFVRWFEPKKADGSLVQFVFERPWYFTTSRILEYEKHIQSLRDLGLSDSALRVADLLGDIAYYTGNDSLQSVFHETKGLIYSGLNNSEDAIREFSLAIEKNPENLNSISYRGYQYGQIEDFENGVKDYDQLTQKLPDYAGGWGGKGWYLIRQGKLFEAQAACQHAYELDSTVTSWIVNLGHIALFFGNVEKAHSYYLQYLEMLTSVKDFEEGIIADFDIFIKNGWQTQNITREKEFINSYFDKHYRNYIIADELLKKGKDEKDKENYRGMVDNMIQALAFEMKNDSLRNQKIHNLHTWLGYGYQYLGKYDSAYTHYNLGLQLAKNELKSEYDIQNDLDLLSWLYKTSGDMVKSDEYNIEKLSQIQRAEDYANKKNLYLISVGVDSYNTFGFKSASGDASDFANSIQNFSKSGYDTVQTVILKNLDAKRENIQAEFEKIVAESKPYDMFVFYFAGFCYADNENFFLATSGFDTLQTKEDRLKNTISAFSLHSMLSSIPARKQWLVFDAQAQKFVNSLISMEISRSNSFDIQKKSLFIHCPSDARIERAEMGQGLLTHTIIEGLEGKAENNATPDGIVSVKEIDNYIFQVMNNPSWYLNFNSYASGRDFPVSFLANYESKKESVPAVVKPQTRGGALIVSDDVKPQTSSSGQTDYALIFASDNYDEWQDLKNPVFDANTLASILEKEYGFKVELVVDANRRTIMDKIISYRKKTYSQADQLFIFFAGHGLYDEENMQEGYIVAKDSKLDDPYKDSYIPFSFLRDQTDGNCQHVLLVLDVCFGGTFSSRQYQIHRGADMYQQISAEEIRSKLTGIKSRYYITSGNKEYVSDGTPGKHSPFASFLIDGLIQGATSRSKFITYNELVSFIDQIKTSTPTHSYYGESEPGGNFIFEVKKAPTVVSGVKQGLNKK